MRIEIWSDIACPWCYIGKRRFEAALAAFEHRDEVQVTWRSFELDPEAPRERSEDGAAHLAAKYGTTREQAVAMQERLSAVAAGEGLAFRLDIARGGSTLDGHRLVHLGAAHGIQDAVKERLLRAYLCEAAPIGDPATLTGLAVEAGLPEDEVRELLAGERFTADVREDEDLARRMGITAVPFFVADRQVGVSGAQTADVMGEFLRQAWLRRPAPVTLVGAAGDGDTCGVDGC